jgi:starvation-inducible outer membrane lipoprotein
MRKTLTALPLIALVLAGCAATPAETETAEVGGGRARCLPDCHAGP